MERRPNNYNIEAVIEKWKLEGEDVPLRLVPYNILYLVSRYFPPQDDWRRFASYLGVENIQTLTEIDGDSHVLKKWPSLLALIHAAQSRSPPTFAELISILHTKMIRLDVIQKLYDNGEVKAFLQKWKCGEVVELSSEEQRQPQKSNLAGEISGDELGAVLRELALKNTLKSKNLASALATKNTVPNTVIQVNACAVEVQQPLKCESERLTTDGANDRNVEEEEKKKNRSVVVATTTTMTIERSRPDRPKQPVILLTYSSDVNGIVPNLVERFNNRGIGVVSEYTLSGKGVLESNPNYVWESLFRQCHFVIPVISNKYLTDVNRRDADCNQSQIVRFIYDLYVDKYVNDGCMNRVVRPLVTSDIDAAKLRSVTPTLRTRWKLWHGLDDLLTLVRNAFDEHMRRTMPN